MSKHDFSAEEFAGRRARVRAAIGAAGLDWLVAFHPVSIHWLTGSDAKSYQEFQCLLVPAKDGPLTVLTRQGEVDEYRDDALVDAIVGWGGGVEEDPIAAFADVARRLEIARVVGDQIYPLDSLREPVRLAAGLGPDKRLDPASQERALACLRRFGERLRGQRAAFAAPQLGKRRRVRRCHARQ